jgi:tape measure domain-containing protein
MQYNAVVREQTKLIQLAKHPFMRMIAARKAMKQATLEATLQDKHYSDAIRKTEKEMLASTSVTMREALATKRNTLEKYKNNLALKHTKELINFNNISIKAYTQSIYRATMALRRFGIFMSRYVSTTMTAATGIGIKMAANIEAQTVRFGILTQSMARGKKLFEDIISFSAKTPFQLGDLDKAAQTLLAFGSPLTDVMDELRRLGDIAQGDSEKLERIVNSFGKVRSRGTAHMRELNRFIMSGVPIIQQLNENIGVTGEQLFKMVETNQITFDDVKKAIVDLTNKEGRFYKMTEKVSKTLEGRFSTALDNFKLDLASLGELWTDNIKQILENFIDWSQGFRMLSDSAKRSIGIAIASLAAIGPVAKAASLAVKGLGASFMALRAILIGGELTNPFTAILAVVQMIGVVFAGF